MRKVMYALLIIFFATATFLMVSVLVTANRAREAVSPIGDLVRDLVIPATPVVLPDRVVIVTEIQDLARLETASYSFEKIIRAERGRQDLLWGALGETLIFVAHGEVVAGVDLSKMQTADLQVVDPETVMVHLPEAEIFHVIPDEERSYVADRDGAAGPRRSQLERRCRGRWPSCAPLPRIGHLARAEQTLRCTWTISCPVWASPTSPSPTRRRRGSAIGGAAEGVTVTPVP